MLSSNTQNHNGREMFFHVDHVIIQYTYTRQVWHICLLSFGLQIQPPQLDDSWEEWWLRVRGQVQAKDGRKFDTLVILVAWMLWKREMHEFLVILGSNAPCHVADRIRDEFKSGS
jgi:hypothetical protein